MKISQCLFSFCALGLILSASHAKAYGPIGHQIVGAVADARLKNTPTGAKVSALLDGLPLEKTAVIPDEIKGWDKKGADDPGIFHYSAHPTIDAQLRDFWRANQPTHEADPVMPSHHWFHYTDVPVLFLEKYADGTAGRTKWDVVHMGRFCIDVLTGKQPEQNERKITKPIAVILLSHYVGDIHQPLHVGAEYFDQAGHAVDPDRGAKGIEDQGGNTITLHLNSGTGKDAKLHGFWDTGAVMANLPQLPDTMPKEERRAKTDAAKNELVRSFSTTEPKNWRQPAGVELGSYPEAWVNELLPIAREAHERLVFQNVTVKPEGDHFLAVGTAVEKPMPDHVAYKDWAAKVVREELPRAGWRLADLLEQALK